MVAVSDRGKLEPLIGDVPVDGAEYSEGVEAWERG